MLLESIAAARVVVNEVLNVRQSETVLITRDSWKTQELSSLLANAVSEVNAIPIELSMPMLSRPGAHLPYLVTKSAAYAAVWIDLNEIYILGTIADHNARRGNVRRFYSLSGMTVNDLILLE